MFKIGIDFDNTIACYDQSFGEVAKLIGLKEGEVLISSKVETKALILARPDGDMVWQQLQGKVYGKHMQLADVFPGFYEFLCLSKLRGNEVFIVSHKSEFGHFDEERVPLREQALTWLRKTGILQGNIFSLDRHNIFFEATREEKLKRICELACSHFVDDLPEVFEERLFPTAVSKILFRPSPTRFVDPDLFCISSWRQLTYKLYGGWSETDIRDAAQVIFPDLGISQVKHCRGRSNSRVYKLTGNLPGHFLLKIYPDRQLDSRPRIETEFAASQELISRSYPVAAPVVVDKNLGWAVFKWVEGDSIACPPDEQFLNNAFEFIQRLYFDSRDLNGFDQFSEASEACFCGFEIVQQIQRRIKKLLRVDSEALKTFLDRELIPYFAAVTRVAEDRAGQLFGVPLDRTLQIPSPSDFGSHNALRDGNGVVTFIDFEYFGWDDPVKLVSDFYWHPGMNLSHELREKWLEKTLVLFKKDLTYSQRLKAYLPLYGLRWCAIILNAYLKPFTGLQSHEEYLIHGSDEVQSKQLLKANIHLQRVKGLVNGNG
jgi:hypothetical protein